MHTTKTIKRKTYTNKLTTLSTSIIFATAVLGMSALSAHSFVTDTSNQKVILIGKGGAENMKAVKVQEIRTTIPSTTPSTATQPQVQSQSGAYMAPNSSGYFEYQNPTTASTTGATRTQVTKTVIPANNQPTQSYAQTYNSQTQSTTYGNDFDRLAVSTNSAAVAVFDMATGRSIYEKNVNTPRAIASITKMMTAMVVLDSGQDLRDELMISSADLQGSGGKNSSTRLRLGDRLPRSQFMLMMLMKSENPAAKTLASNYHGGYSAFINAMNQKAQSLGMYNTNFSDPSGLHPRNVSTASDLVKMMREIGTNPRYQTIRNFSTAPSYDFYITNYNTGNRTYSAGNTSSLVRTGVYPIGASKTGFIREAGHCVVMETHVNGRPAIIVLLGAKGSQSRWNDAETILGQLAYLR